MTRIGSVIVSKERVKAPRHIEEVCEDGVWRRAMFRTVGFVDRERIRFVRDGFKEPSEATS